MDKKIKELLVKAESAMFHVLADNGFNGPADKKAMACSIREIREALKATKNTKYMVKVNGPFGPRQTSETIIQEYATEEERQKYLDTPKQLVSVLKIWEEVAA